MNESRPPLTEYSQLAKMIDHSLLKPQLQMKHVAEGCEIARKYNVANVTVRPCDAGTAVDLMKGSGIPVGSVVGFPHGAHSAAVKLYETRELIEAGAREIDMVINIGRMISREFGYVESEVGQIAEACRAGNAILKVIFENAYLSDDLKIAACQICKRCGADFAKTSTGFAPSGATIEDLKLMYRHCAPEVQVKAAGGIRALDQAIEAYQAGCSRIGATATVSILEDWKQRLAE